MSVGLGVDGRCPGGGEHRIGTPRVVSSTAEGLEIEAHCRTCSATLYGYLDATDLDVANDDDSVVFD